MTPGWIRPLFLFAAAYDIVLGLVYCFAFRTLYARFGITLPNHDAYVQLPAALIVVFGLGFWFVANDPTRNRDLITLGVLMKLAFAGIVFGHRWFGSMPSMWVPFAVCDTLFALAFLAARRAVAAPAKPA